MLKLESQNHSKSKQIILEYHSAVESDVSASIALTSRFLHDLRRWLLTRQAKNTILWDFALRLPVKKAVKSAVKSTKVFTVIRSPFVYKKTREQFALCKRAYHIPLQLTKAQQSIFVQFVSELKLPAELKIHFK